MNISINKKITVGFFPRGDEPNSLQKQRALMTQTVPLHRHGAAWRVNCSISSEIAFLITNRDRDFFMVQLIIHHQKVANIRTSSSAYQKDSPSLTANTATFGAHLTPILIASAFPWMPCNSLSAVAWKLIPTFCSKN